MSNTKLFVGHLPDDATHGDLEQLMKHLNWDENQIRRCEINLVHDRATDKFKGFAYVDVKSEECAEQFLKLDGADFGDKRLRVDRATPKESHRGGGRGGSRGGFRGGRGGGEFQRGGDEAGRGGGGSRGGFRDRRGSHGGRGGYTERRGSQSDEKHDLDKNGNQEEPATPLPERPRLKLTPLTTDPAALEAKKKREAEEEAARRAKLFQA